MAESGVARIDHRLGDDGCRPFGNAGIGERFVNRLLQPVTDHSLAHGAARVQGHRRCPIRGGRLLLQHDIADLGTVAVGHHDIKTRLDDPEQLFRRLFTRPLLGLCRRLVLGFLQGVSSER